METYQQNGLKLWNRAEISATLDPSEDPLKCLDELRKEVRAFLSEPASTLTVNPEYAHLLNGGALPVSQVEEVDEKGGFLEAIKGCTSLKSLEIFKKLVDRQNDDALTEAYNNKLKDFK